jgi:hypothetical protein
MSTGDLPSQTKKSVELYAFGEHTKDHHEIPVILIGDMNGRIDNVKDHFTSR